MGISLLCFPGCGSESVTEGFVRFESGIVVQSGKVEIRSLDAANRYAGRIQPDGSFELKNGSGTLGVPPGEYEAVVVQVVMTEDLALEHHEHGETVPRRYADYYTSDLRVTVTEGQTEPIEIVLQEDEDA